MVLQLLYYYYYTSMHYKKKKKINKRKNILLCIEMKAFVRSYQSQTKQTKKKLNKKLISNVKCTTCTQYLPSTN